MDPDAMAWARTMLFVPGHRPERFDKAAGAGADAIILDLEDAVGPDHKDTARDHVRQWLERGRSGIVRINAAGTAWHDDDVAMVRRHRCVVMLPKTEDPGATADLVDRLPPGSSVIPLIETAVGVMRARELCGAPGVVRPVFGNVDLAVQLGVDHTDHQALSQARAMLVLAAAAAGVAPPLDGVTTAVDDEQALVDDTVHAMRLGFTGKLCIHPRQVAPVHTVLAPSPEAMRWALRVVSAAADGSVTLLDGRMIDKPVVDRARRVLDRAARSR